MVDVAIQHGYANDEGALAQGADQIDVKTVETDIGLRAFAVSGEHRTAHMRPKVGRRWTRSHCTLAMLISSLGSTTARTNVAISVHRKPEFGARMRQCFVSAAHTQCARR
jgi:hypothetical protein